MGETRTESCAAAVACSFLLAMVATSASSAQTTTRSDISKVWVLDNADPDFSNPPFQDTLTVLEARSGIAIVRAGGGDRVGFNITQAIGAFRILAVSLDGAFAFINELASDRLTKVDSRGNPVWSLPGKFNSVATSRNGYLYVLSGYTISGDSLLQIDPDDGRVVKEAPLGGLDLVVDDANDAIWIVGSDVKKVSRDLELIFTVDPIGWTAVSVDYRSDGSVWVAERTRASPARLFHMGANGVILGTVPLSFQPGGISVDRSDDSVWLARRVQKFDRWGAPIVSTSEIASSLCVDQADGSVWLVGISGTVRHLAADGTPVSVTPGFSTDEAWVMLDPQP